MLVCRQPSVSKKRFKHQVPDKPLNGHDECRVHKCKLVHKLCSATCVLKISDNGTHVNHRGTRSHPRPHETPSKKSLEWLKNLVNNNSEAMPNQIRTGNRGRPATRDIHPALNNLDVLAHHRRQIMKKKGKFKLLEFLI